MAFSKLDKIESLNIEQLEELVQVDSSWVIAHLERDTVFDAHRVRLLIELGLKQAEELKRVKEELARVKSEGL
ncbi:hypothetical protein [Vibrio barjaei]|uniref:hypothetical protein n=1 Tax=Vibrio barjaei TaxID=1676683 RepID=UPI0022839431|nr:hypothetical protein [Vibrio barjaei]MCY9874056.1 hypothetical protein [Vibrio barjaei]